MVTALGWSPAVVRVMGGAAGPYRLSLRALLLNTPLDKVTSRSYVVWTRYQGHVSRLSHAL